eukprot:394182_1
MDGNNEISLSNDLHAAIRKADVESVRRILADAGVEDVNGPDKRGIPPLLKAARLNKPASLEIFELLLANREIDVTVIDKSKCTAVMVLASLKPSELVVAKLENLLAFPNIDVKAVNGCNQTALHMISRKTK